jgi:putative endonuclease
MNAQRERRRRYALGRWAETLCAWHLRCRAYRILARRFKTPVGEIDLIARRGRTLAFIEVKARNDEATAMDSITQHQRRRVWRAAQLFIAGDSRVQDCDVRFDVMVVVPNRLPRHIEDAWRGDAIGPN